MRAPNSKAVFVETRTNSNSDPPISAAHRGDIIKIGQRPISLCDPHNSSDPIGTSGLHTLGDLHQPSGARSTALC